MANYICGCGDHESECSTASIKVTENGVVHDIKCPCGQYMHLSNPKKGVPSLGNMGRYGRSK
jgi:hypothetical protein